MASKQTRRSISVRGTTYAALRDYCEGHDRSMSDVVEELLAGVIDSKPAAKKTVAHYVARASSASANVVKQKEEIEIQLASEQRPSESQPKPGVAPPKPSVATLATLKPAVPAKAMGPGRPAPTPAHKVVAPRQESAIPKNDYRTINF